MEESTSSERERSWPAPGNFKETVSAKCLGARGTAKWNERVEGEMQRVVNARKRGLRYRFRKNYSKHFLVITNPISRGSIEVTGAKQLSNISFLRRESVYRADLGCAPSRNIQQSSQSVGR